MLTNPWSDHIVNVKIMFWLDEWGAILVGIVEVSSGICFQVELVVDQVG